MKKVTKILAAALMIAVATTTFSGCGKYEDGPGLSLLSKKARVCGTWEVEKYLVDGVDKTSDYRALVTSETMEIKKDETYSYSATYVNGSDTDAGTWKFDNDKADFTTQSNSTGSTPDTWEIRRLTNKEFWVKEKNATSNVVEIHYKSK